jgi:hypothetical protein
MNEEINENFFNDFLKFIAINVCSCYTNECDINDGTLQRNPVVPKISMNIQKTIANYKNTKSAENKECNMIKIYNMIPDGIFNDFNDYKLQSNDFLFTKLDLPETAICKNFEHCMIIDYLISKFLKYKLLSKRGNGKLYYILNSDKVFVWQNVMNIDKDLLFKFAKEYPQILRELIQLYCDDQYSVLIENDLFIEILSIDVNNLFEEDQKFVIQLTNLIKSLFWYLRKAIVDSLLVFIIKQHNIGFPIGMSVGSTKLSSDYDITLYAQTKITTKIIADFNTVFENIFRSTSTEVFDTNIYGISFINLARYQKDLLPQEQLLFSEQKRCKVGDSIKNFYYLKQNDDVKYTQHVWSISKLLYKIRKLDKVDYSTFINKLSNKTKCKPMGIYLDISNKLYNELYNYEREANVYSYLIYVYNIFENKILESIVETQKDWIPEETGFKKGSVESINLLMSPMTSKTYKISPDLTIEQIENEENNSKCQINNENSEVSNVYISNLLIQNNFISLVNFFGSETYFTRGAFLDIVINEQMCRGEEEKIKLSEDEYIDSFIENMADYINDVSKKKYIERAEKAIQKTKYYSLISEKFKKLKNNISLMEEIEYINKICEIISIIINEHLKNTAINKIHKQLYIMQHITKVLKDMYESTSFDFHGMYNLLSSSNLELNKEADIDDVTDTIKNKFVLVGSLYNPDTYKN